MAILLIFFVLENVIIFMKYYLYQYVIGQYYFLMNIYFKNFSMLMSNTVNIERYNPRTQSSVGFSIIFKTLNWS